MQQRHSEGHRRTWRGEHRLESEEGESRRAGGLPEQAVPQMGSDLEATETYLPLFKQGRCQGLESRQKSSEH